MHTSVVHPFPPVYDKNSVILIVGSVPSVKSRAEGFYYGHPQNRFWKIMAGITGETLPVTVMQKQTLLRKHRIALWDVLYSCDIAGSSDASIKNAVVNDFSDILESSCVEAIFANGKAAATLYNKLVRAKTHTDCMYLPSTSPANAGWRYDALLMHWQEALNQYLNGGR